MFLAYFRSFGRPFQILGPLYKHKIKFIFTHRDTEISFIPCVVSVNFLVGSKNIHQKDVVGYCIYIYTGGGGDLNNSVVHMLNQRNAKKKKKSKHDSSESWLAD